jgi:hypothetical protein
LLIPQGKVSTSGRKIHGLDTRNILPFKDWEVRKYCTGRKMNLQIIKSLKLQKLGTYLS